MLVEAVVLLQILVLAVLVAVEMGQAKLWRVLEELPTLVAVVVVVQTLKLLVLVALVS